MTKKQLTSDLFSKDIIWKGFKIVIMSLFVAILIQLLWNNIFARYFDFPLMDYKQSLVLFVIYIFYRGMMYYLFSPDNDDS